MYIADLVMMMDLAVEYLKQSGCINTVFQLGMSPNRSSAINSWAVVKAVYLYSSLTLASTHELQKLEEDVSCLLLPS